VASNNYNNSNNSSRTATTSLKSSKETVTGGKKLLELLEASGQEGNEDAA